VSVDRVGNGWSPGNTSLQNPLYNDNDRTAFSCDKRTVYNASLETSLCLLVGYVLW